MCIRDRFYTDGRKADRDIICKLSGDAAGGRQIVQKAGGDSAEVPNYNGWSVSYTHLRYWFSDSYKDIAEFVGLSEKNISVRLTRIREKMKQYLIEREVFVLSLIHI